MNKSGSRDTDKDEEEKSREQGERGRVCE